MLESTVEISETAVRAARDLRVMISRLRRRLRDVAGHTEDLTAPQTSALIRLHKAGPLSASGLAAVEGVRPQSMAATLAALDRHGLVERRPDPEDGRRLLISLTALGRQRAAVDRRVREEWLARALQDRYTEDERLAIVEATALLDRLTRW